MAWKVTAQPGETVQITALAFNDRGRISLPAPQGEIRVRVAN